MVKHSWIVNGWKNKKNKKENPKDEKEGKQKSEKDVVLVEEEELCGSGDDHFVLWWHQFTMETHNNVWEGEREKGKSFVLFSNWLKIEKKKVEKKDWKIKIKIII